VNLLIDARKLADGGIGTYLRNLIEGLDIFNQNYGNKINLNTVITKGDSYASNFLKSVSRVNVQEINVSSSYSLRDHLLFAKKVDWSGIELFHTPHYTLPRFIKFPQVVTIHDLIHLTFPESFYYPFFAKFFLNYTFKNAAHIISVSNATKLELENLIIKHHKNNKNIPITFIPNAFYKHSLNTCCSLELNKPFFLGVLSNNKPHKNTALLINSFKLFVNKLNSKPPTLYLVGNGSIEIKGDLGDYIKLLGKVDKAILNYLYKNALALVVPSLTEGFCLPVLEAHSYGTRAVVTPVPAIKELVLLGDVVATDFTEESFAEALEEMYNSVVVNPDNLKLSFDIDKYSLLNIAKMTVSVYESLLKIG
jgi:glycosyltransferase involved in cell wall biosynthesis